LGIPTSSARLRKIAAGRRDQRKMWTPVIWAGPNTPTPKLVRLAGRAFLRASRPQDACKIDSSGPLGIDVVVSGPFARAEDRYGSAGVLYFESGKAQAGGVSSCRSRFATLEITPDCLPTGESTTSNAT